MNYPTLKRIHSPVAVNIVPVEVDKCNRYTLITIYFKKKKIKKLKQFTSSWQGCFC